MDSLIAFEQHRRAHLLEQAAGIRASFEAHRSIEMNILEELESGLRYEALIVRNHNYLPLGRKPGLVIDPSRKFAGNTHVARGF